MEDKRVKQSKYVTHILKCAKDHGEEVDPDKDIPMDEQFPEGMFRFEKRIDL